MMADKNADKKVTPHLRPRQYPLHALSSSLPKAGFLLPSRPYFLSRPRCDRTVMEFLREHGGCTNLQAGAHGKPRKQIEAALATMFREAQRVVEDNESILKEMATFELPALIRPSVAFASPGSGHKGLDEDIFIELFTELLSARRAWWENPRMPFHLGEHGELARAIDDFDMAVGNDWVAHDPEDDLFAMAVSDPTAPRNRVNDAMDEVKDVDDLETVEDIELVEDGEVREVRERLAGAGLNDEYAETEMDWES